MAQLTESIVEFLVGNAADTAPEKALALAVDGFTDCIAVMLAAVNAPVTRNLKRHVRLLGGNASSRVLLGKARATVSQATLIGVGAAHALDYDDYAFSNHVSALLVPAILAEAERSGGSGRAMVAAYLAGFEVWGTLMKREPDHLHSKGWHPTGVFGAIGVAAAIARLRQLDAQHCRHALGLAAAAGGGVMDNFGTQAKAYQGARAAEAGVTCVELALAGVDAGPHAIDGDGGLLAALSPRGHVDRDSPASALGRDWIAAADSLNIKRHPTVGASQRLIDAAIQVHDDHAPPVDEIAEVVARVSEKHAAVMRFHRPTTALEAKFSVEFGIAAGLIEGQVGLAQLDDGFVMRDDVQALLARVRIETAPDDDPDYPVGLIADSLTVHLADRRVIASEPVHRFRGHGQNPMNTDELREKFTHCVAPGFGRAAAHELWHIVRRLPALRGAAELPELSPR